MATRATKTKTKTKTKKSGAKKASTKKAVSAKKAASKRAVNAKATPTTKRKTAGKKDAAKKTSRAKKFPPVKPSKKLPPRASRAVKQAAEALWDVGVSPHELVNEVREVLLLRCLSEAQGNYASAAKLFGPSRQSVQQYANSKLRDERWIPYQQNQRT